METPNLLTLADVARLLNERLNRVKYAVDEYRIEPRQRAGIIRLWHPDDVPAIRAALTRIANRRGGGR